MEQNKASQYDSLFNFFKKETQTVPPLVEGSVKSFVTSVVPYEEEGQRVGYQINGHNESNQLRGIIVFDDKGRQPISVYDQSINIGRVGKQMLRHKDDIFYAFDIENPSLSAQLYQ